MKKFLQKIVFNQNTSIRNLMRNLSNTIDITDEKGFAIVVNKKNECVGTITDGDLRRMLAKTENFTNLSAIDIMTKNPKSIDINAMAVDAMQLMEKHQITQLLVTDNEMYAGVIHLHDLMKEGIL